MSKFGEGDRFHILTPLSGEDEIDSFETLSKRVTDIGFVRFQIGNVTYSVADIPDGIIPKNERIYIVIDRLIKKDEDNF